MSIKKLREYIFLAEKNKQAIGHFNVSNIEGFWAIMEAAEKLTKETGEKVPVIIGVSEGEEKNIGRSQIVAIIKSYQKENDYPVFLNADHCYSVERAKKAIDAGYDMVIIDLAKESYEENLKATKEVVAYRNLLNSETLVEAELGFIGSGSDIKDEMPEGVTEETMTKPDEALEFVSQTNLDLLAPAVGNVHGIIKSGNPALSPERVKSVRESCGIPLVLHGGSGSSDEDFLKVINDGISVIHISSELRRAFREALEKSLKENDTIGPYKYLKPAKEAMSNVAYGRMKLFWRA